MKSKAFTHSLLLSLRLLFLPPFNPLHKTPVVANFKGAPADTKTCQLKSHFPLAIDTKHHPLIELL